LVDFGLLFPRETWVGDHARTAGGTALGRRRRRFELDRVIRQDWLPWHDQLSVWRELRRRRGGLGLRCRTAVLGYPVDRRSALAAAPAPAATASSPAPNAAGLLACFRKLVTARRDIVLHTGRS
jgi:hypothetical protein